MKHPVETAVLKALKESKTAPFEVIIAAVSGGADSAALLTALAKTARTISINVRCVHIQHNLRGKESKDDENFVRELCERFGIPCAVLEIPEGLLAREAAEKGCGPEAAARERRHALLRSEAKKNNAKKILIAHTYDDLLETILMRVLRGAGPAGLAPLPKENGIILRPLIGSRRVDICSYLEQEGVSFRNDSSNLSDIPFRNRIRHKLIPVLNDFFPHWDKNIYAFAQTQRIISDYISKKTKRIIEHSGAPSSGIKNFFSYPQFLREELIFDLINRVSGEISDSDGEAIRSRPPRRSTIRQAASGDARVFDTGNIRIFTKDGTLRVLDKKSLKPDKPRRN